MGGRTTATTRSTAPGASTGRLRCLRAAFLDWAATARPARPTLPRLLPLASRSLSAHGRTFVMSDGPHVIGLGTCTGSICRCAAVTPLLDPRRARSWLAAVCGLDFFACTYLTRHRHALFSLLLRLVAESLSRL
eukprot:6181241-Pleurochrysis_carterae.AAC.1